MSKQIVYYITGHGFGHARRSAAVIRRLVAEDADVVVQIRTSAPRHIFDDTIGPRVEHHPVAIDPGAVEKDALRINPAGTIRAVRECLRNKASIIRSELKSLPHNVRLIVADAPFFAGDIAEAAGLPSIIVSNFTWDWIYEPLLENERDGGDIMAEIQASYSKIPVMIKLPFGQRSDMFREVIPSPVVANGPRFTRQQVREKLNLNGGDARPLALIGHRGGFAPEVLDRAVRSAPDFRFLYTHPLPSTHADNLIPVHLNGELFFGDLLCASDAVISKLGHATACDCIGAGVPILWPPRSGFREDELIQREAGPYLRMRRIEVDDFEQGNWSEGLRDLLRLASPQPTRTDGDAVCARELARRLR